MMKKMILVLGLTLALGIGCSKETVPRFQGRLVSHVGAYGSGTGVESELNRAGSMKSGFDYGDQATPDWTSETQWFFQRQEKGNDVYRCEHTFRPKSGAGGTQVVEVPFDGLASAIVFSNQWQVVSIEPGMAKTDSQPGVRR